MAALKAKSIELVVNIPSPRSSNAVGDFLMRRTAVDHATPLLTNARVAALLADSLERHSRTPMVGLVPEALADHYRKESDADAWTSKREFH